MRKYILGFVLLLVAVFGFAYRSNLFLGIGSFYKLPAKPSKLYTGIDQKEFLENIIDETNCIRLGGNNAVALWDTVANRLSNAYFYVDKEQLSKFNARTLNTLSASMEEDKVNMLDWIAEPVTSEYFDLELEHAFVQGIGREWFENLSLWVQKYNAVTVKLKPIYAENHKIAFLELKCSRNSSNGLLTRMWKLPNMLSPTHLDELTLDNPNQKVTKKWLNEWPIHPKKFELRISKWNYN